MGKINILCFKKLIILGPSLLPSVFYVNPGKVVYFPGKVRRVYMALNTKPTVSNRSFAPRDLTDLGWVYPCYNS